MFSKAFDSLNYLRLLTLAGLLNQSLKDINLMCDYIKF